MEFGNLVLEIWIYILCVGQPVIPSIQDFIWFFSPGSLLLKRELGRGGAY